jgi:hypothetical protein
MTSESLRSLQHIPYRSAYLCGSCEAIGNSAMRCPACASESLVSMAAVLNREPRTESTFRILP